MQRYCESYIYQDLIKKILKRLHFIEDYHGYRCSLHYLRDKDGREVDFVTVVNDKIFELIEVKILMIQFQQA